MDETAPARQRAAGLLLLPPLLAEAGVSFEAVLDGTGVAPADIRPDAFVPYAAFLVILERAARLTGREDLGLRLGQAQTLGVLGPLGAAMRLAPTLGAALGDFAAFQITNSTGSAVYLHRGGGDLVFGYGIYAGPVSPQMHDAVIAVGCTILRELTDGAVRPAEILTMRPRPADAGPWHRLAGCPVRFGEGETCLVLPAGAVGHPLRAADRHAHADALAALATRPGSGPWDWRARVAHALRPLLLEGRASMPEVARELATTPRTLRRALAREGTTFEAVRDRVLHAVARELLALTALPAGEVGLRLGYATPSGFTRAFRRWSGTTPGRGR